MRVARALGYANRPTLTRPVTGFTYFSSSSATMSRTFNLPGHNVPVVLPEGLSEDQLLSFRPFNVTHVSKDPTCYPY